MRQRAYIIYDATSGKIRQVSIQFRPPSEFSLGVGGAFIENDPDPHPDVTGKIVVGGALVDDPDYSPPVVDPLTQIRNERNAMLRDSLWTQVPDAPLTIACIEAFRVWRVQLNRWLVDYPEGDTPLPAQPSIEYLPLEDQV